MDQHPSVNNLYLSERLQKTLAGIGSHTVTTVIAPMGYGKSTALKWWQQQLAARIPHAKIFRQLVAADSRQDFWDGFCRTLRRWPTLAARRPDTKTRRSSSGRPPRRMRASSHSPAPD